MFGFGSGYDVRVMGLSPESGYGRHGEPAEGSLSSSATPTPPPKRNRRERENVCRSPLRHPFVKMPGIRGSR